MRAVYVTIPLSLLLAGAGAAMYYSSKQPSPDTSGVITQGQVRHDVTPTMLQDALERSRAKAPDFEVKDTEGKTHTLASLTDGKPLFLYFIMDGCPCSIDVEPLYQRLHRHLQGKVNFVAITDANAEKAAKWVKDWGSGYPIVSMPDKSLMKTYNARQSVYGFLITPDGQVDKVWPGYSRDMLKEANAKMSKLAGLEEKPFDPLYAPKELASGCYFFESDGKS